MDTDQKRAVEAILRHDLDSSGAELVYYFVHELGVLEREAWQAVVSGRSGNVSVSAENYGRGRS
jgi:hypothetical protein